jgi:hypothetical protein
MTAEIVESKSEEIISDASNSKETKIEEGFEILEYFPDYSISKPSFQIKNNKTNNVLKPVLNKYGYRVSHNNLSLIFLKKYRSDFYFENSNIITFSCSFFFIRFKIRI